MAERKINGSTYRVEPPLATLALGLKLRIAKLAGPGFEVLPVALASLQSKDQALKEGAGSAVIDALGKVMAKIDPDDVTDLMGDVVAMAKVKDATGYGPVDLDGWITEHPGDLYPLMGFVLETAIGPFFPGGAAKLKSVARKAH